MTEIGRLKPTVSGKLDELTGYIRTLKVGLIVRVTGNELLCDGRAPSHRVYAKLGSGPEVEVGAAWLKTAKSGPTPGAKFFTLSIDDPDLPAPLNVNVYADGTNGEFKILWRRREMQPVAAATQ